MSDIEVQESELSQLDAEHQPIGKADPDFWKMDTAGKIDGFYQNIKQEYIYVGFKIY